MPRVTVEPSGIQFEAQPGQVLMAAARQAGLYWPTTCDMRQECAVCHVRVLSDVRALGGLTSDEATALRLVARRYRDLRPGELRLACAATVLDEVVVQRRGVRVAR